MSKFEEEQRLMAFRFYVTDMLYFQSQGETLTYRYIDLINDKLDDEEEITKDNVDDFILSLIDKAGLEVTE